MGKMSSRPAAPLIDSGRGILTCPPLVFVSADIDGPGIARLVDGQNVCRSDAKSASYKQEVMGDRRGGGTLVGANQFRCDAQTIAAEQRRSYSPE